MATKTYTEDEILALLLGALQAAYPRRSVGPKSDLGQLARAVAQTLGAVQSAIRDADRDGVPASEYVDGVLKSRASSARLDEWAVIFGLPSNRAAGAFGRNGATTARYGGGNVVGTPGTVVPGGSLLVDLSGQVQVQLLSGVTVGVSGTIAGVFQATSAGAAGNLAAGTTLRWVSPVAGLASTVSLTTALTGGSDSESDLTLLMRLLDWLRSPPHAGTPADLRRWVVEATDATGASLGINRGYVYKFRRGMCSSDVVITVPGTGSTRDPGGKAAAAQAYLDARTLPSESVKVVRPYFDPAQRLTITVRGIPSVAGAFDWYSLSGIAIVSSTTTVVTILTASIPMTLISAVAAGRQPRLQFSLPSISPVPFQRRIINTTIVGFNTLYTLDSALPATPANGDTVYPGGGCVTPLSIAILNYVDNVGPSQQSGLNDKVTDAWEAVVSIGRIAQNALEAVDASGARVLVYSPSVGSGVGVTIAVGNGSPTGDDFLLYDNVPGQGPQLPEVNKIIVLQGT